MLKLMKLLLSALRDTRTRNPGARAYPYADPVNQNKTTTASEAQSIRNSLGNRF